MPRDSVLLFAIAFCAGGIAGAAGPPVPDHCDTACRNKTLFFSISANRTYEYLIPDCAICTQGKCKANTNPDGVSCDREIVGMQRIDVYAGYEICYYTPGQGIS